MLPARTMCIIARRKVRRSHAQVTHTAFSDELLQAACRLEPDVLIGDAFYPTHIGIHPSSGQETDPPHAYVRFRSQRKPIHGARREDPTAPPHPGRFPKNLILCVSMFE